MKISTKGRYALDLMVDLAENNTGEYIPINSIASRQGISVKYLEQIISVISKAGYVKSIRGSQGGYKLSKKPSDYTIGMILRLMEGDLSPVPEVSGAETADKLNKSSTGFIWEKLSNAINSVVDSITLEDVINKNKEASGFDYYI